MLKKEKIKAYQQGWQNGRLSGIKEQTFVICGNIKLMKTKEEIIEYLEKEKQQCIENCEK